MQPRSKRRVHGAEFKAQVMAECRRPGASVSAVSMKHGLNVNVVRKWLVGRGLKRMGLEATSGEVVTAQTATPMLHFVPLDLQAPAACAPTSALAPESMIQVAVSRGQMQMSVQWPASQAAACGLWLREVIAVAK